MGWHYLFNTLYKDFATPITNKHYIAQPYGELYGLDHTAKRMAPSMAAKLRPETDIPGLYLTGQVSYFEYKFLLHPWSTEHFSLKNDEDDQTIWNCILEL